ncbi:hypothetical protein GCM10010991_25200 [Gemmobacter aquaticus]|uniref:AAA+ ATPase domain-containing protein n=1 Tax=Gemmobacter aquaticus TaxID=490185 RepID=A0A918DD14_9RHOB|nr:hypothetical protein GCM10010991_25200 [Gemmobacter aquaticus]
MPEAAPKAVAAAAENLGDLFPKLDRELDEMDMIHPSSPPRVIDEVCLRPRPATLMAALQIAKTFETQEVLEAALSDRSQITVLCAHAAKLAPSVALLLNAASAQGAEEAPFVARVSEVLREGSDSAGRTFSGLRDTFIQALEQGQPITLVAASAHDLLKPVQSLGATCRDLVPLDASILDVALRVAYPDCDPVCPPANLPVGHLEPEDLALACRAETRQGAIEILTQRLSPQVVKGPGLMEFPLPAEVKSTLKRMIEDLLAWQAGEIAWADVTRGLLLVGPPGTGKTEIARLLARDAGFETIATSLAQWSSDSGRSGEILKSMRAAFSRAQTLAPCILYIDELDALGDRNRAPDHNSAWTDFIIGGLLECLDGFANREGVIVIGATNHLAKIDPAIRRPGRFDTFLRLEVSGPDLLPEVFRWHLKDDLPSADLVRLSQMAEAMSGAQVAALVRTARSHARSERRALALADLEAEIRNLRPPLPPSQLWRVAVHEAGHAIVAAANGAAIPVALAIGSGGGWAAFAMPAGHQTRDDIRADLCRLLAGRAAERLVLGNISAGAGGGAESDLAKATQLATATEISWGLGSSRVWLGDTEASLSRLVLDAHLRQRIETQLARAETGAMQLLTRFKPVLIDLATALCTQKRIEGTELERHLSKVTNMRAEAAEDVTADFS